MMFFFCIFVSVNLYLCVSVCVCVCVCVYAYVRAIEKQFVCASFSVSIEIQFMMNCDEHMLW